MANSLITRCPKCSTAFRVSNEVLITAKGKVRCGQCFNIFDAKKYEKTKETVQKSKADLAQPAHEKVSQSEKVRATESAEKHSTPDEEIVNPDWLDSLFDDKDLQPSSEARASSSRKEEAHGETRKRSTQNTTTKTEEENELAPWEIELAKVEAALKTASTKPAASAQPKPNPAKQTSNTEAKPTPEKDPDYMVALQSLAQNASEQTRPSNMKSQHSILDQLSAQENLAPLLEEHEPSMDQTNSHAWLYFLGILLGLALLAGQVAVHFFDQGSRSANFRSIYRTICAYYNCVLPKFEDVNAITIQHVRIQSHPTIKNTLLVNAIITNASGFSQSMPKMALEFFDLNGAPVAARLFSPADYLHKDFLDITYMPPNTPIHLVIPIQDPGARAVTHQLKAYPSDTRSY